MFQAEIRAECRDALTFEEIQRDPSALGGLNAILVRFDADRPTAELVEELTSLDRMTARWRDAPLIAWWDSALRPPDSVIKACASAIIFAHPGSGWDGAEEAMPTVCTAIWHPYFHFSDYHHPMDRTDILVGGAKPDEVGPAALDRSAYADWELPTVLRRCAVAVLADDVDDEAILQRFELRCAATTCLPIRIGPGGRVEGIEAGDAGSVAEAMEMVGSLLASPLALRARSHRNWRQAFSRYSLTAMVRRMLTAAGLETNVTVEPSVTVFIPTIRPQGLSTCLQNYDCQAYANKSLVMALHSDEWSDYPAPEREDVRYVGLPLEATVGSVMNVALVHAAGDYVIKMDDDDFYGPDYVGDMMLSLLAVDVDVFGKPPWFVYFQTYDATYLRRSRAARENCVTSTATLLDPDFRISGATHSGRRAYLLSHGFCSRNRFAGDTALYERLASEPGTVLSLDGFSTTIFRGDDISQHTWRVASEVLLRQAQIVPPDLFATVINP